MKIINNIQEWRSIRHSLNKTVGFVPTMGNLHQGHLSLVDKAQQDNAITVVSIFVNPTQFDNRADFIHYPSTLEKDFLLLREAGIDYCFLPDYESLYPDNYELHIEESALANQLEGKHRPGHFNGVLTVVMKLLNIIKPDNAYFGEKDYQQYLLIKKMVNSFFMPINVHACPTIREESGLAFSSRNNRLSGTQKKLAEIFAQIFHTGKSCRQIIEKLNQQKITIDYVEEYASRRYSAVFIDDIRLIDNYAI